MTGDNPCLLVSFGFDVGPEGNLSLPYFHCSSAAATPDLLVPNVLKEVLLLIMFHLLYTHPVLELFVTLSLHSSCLFFLSG